MAGFPDGGEDQTLPRLASRFFGADGGATRTPEDQFRLGLSSPASDVVRPHRSARSPSDHRRRLGIAFKAPEKVQREADLCIDDLKDLLDYV